MSDWVITLPSEDELEAAFHHPQLLRNPNPVSKSDGDDSVFARYRLLAGIVNVADDDWDELKDVFKATLEIVSSAAASDYIGAISQTIALGEAAEGEWRDHRTDLELTHDAIAVTFKNDSYTGGDHYYGYVVQAPSCRWDRYIDDPDLLAETTGLVQCNQLFYDENGQERSIGRVRRAASSPVVGFGYYSPILNVGVGTLRKGEVEHQVNFTVTMQVTTPDDNFITDPSILIEKDPYMATRMPELKLIVAAGSTAHLGVSLGVPEARIRELLGLKGRETGQDETEEESPSPSEGAAKGREVSIRISGDAVTSVAKAYPLFRGHIRHSFVPRNKLAAAFVSLIDRESIPRVGPLVEAMSPIRRRRLADGLGLPRGSDPEQISKFLKAEVFVKG